MESFLSWIPVIGLIGFIIAIVTYFQVLKYPEGSEKMKDIAQKIHIGAMVFLKKEYSKIFIFMVIVFVALWWAISVWTGLAYLVGALFSMGAGWLGMMAATRANVRTCQGAKDGGIARALFIAYQGGSVMGITIASLGVLGLGALFLLTRHYMQLELAPEVINGFAMGASSIALFARVGGGIYTKSADVGADLVGKVEAGIPEDDPRNPGVIADNVGDNVGDTAGMGADLFESYVGAVVAAIALGVSSNIGNQDLMLRFTSYPLFLITTGMISSLIGIMSMGALRKMEPSKALNWSTWIAGIAFIISGYFITKTLMGTLNTFWAAVAGIVCGLLIAQESEWFTSADYNPVKEIAKASESGAATTIISGIAIGYKSTILPILTLCVTIAIAYSYAGLYGIAIAGIGMLATIGAVMTTDS
ncbi:MAG: sodium/proton-translocating pyrophosphatase, partial [Vulcanimicrobiota bacterium]